MKKIVLISIFTVNMFQVIHAQEAKSNNSFENPFLKKYNTPYEIPPFDLIKNEHFKPTYLKGIEIQNSEILVIKNNKSVANFNNTILALENSGALLQKVSAVFNNLNSANTNPEIQQIAKEISPLMSAHYDNIYLDSILFKKVKAVWDNQAKMKLTSEDKKLLEKTYKRFVRNGANLDVSKKDILKKLNTELSLSSLTFGQNLLAETNSYELIVNDIKELEGIPEDLIQAAASKAKSKEKAGYMFTLSNASVMPFLQYASNRNLRKTIWDAYVNRGNNNNKNDNNKLAIDLANKRMDKAHLLGYKTYAEYALEETMAKSPEKVNDFLLKLWKPAIEKAKKEEAMIAEMMRSENIFDAVQPYDWRYYEEKIRKAKYSLDEQEVKSYFSITNVQNGVFLVCQKLFGLTFKPLKNAPTYHKEATVWEVFDGDNKVLGVLLMDFHPRSSKRGGAWMTSYKSQSTNNGKRDLPVISIVCNFTSPNDEGIALLTMDETITFFHEFGHALHGLLSNVKYKSLSGTNVSRDFVELPSQVMENWATEPEVMKLYAKHYKNGNVIPNELIEKMKNAATFGQGFATVEYLASSILDMDFHNISEPIKETSAEAYEKKSMEKHGLIKSIVPRHRATFFSHVFSGGYSAGYYSYIWSGVLDTDAFEQFKTTSLFNPEKSKSFRKNILEKGGTEDPMDLYKKFRGSEPSIEPLLRKRGLNEK
ncbi:MAG: M3 family metallopeptidase [Flavobacterium sp.]